MTDHTPCVRINNIWTVDGSGEAVAVDGEPLAIFSEEKGFMTVSESLIKQVKEERSGHPDDEEVLDDEYELPNIDIYDILGGAAPIIGKYFSVFGGGDEDTNVRIVQGLVLAARIYRDMKELVEKDDKKGVEELVSVVFTKIFDLARAEYLSKEAKKEEERRCCEERLKMMQADDDRLKQEIDESNDATITRAIDAYIARKKALKKEKAERAPVTDLH